MTTIAVAVVNHDTREQLRACLRAIQLEAPGEVVVVDNASGDGSVEMVQAEFPSVMLLRNEANRGYGAGANQAVARVRAAYVLLLNGDTMIRPGALRALSDYLDRSPRAAVAGPRLVNADGTLQASCYSFPTMVNTLRYASGGTEHSELGRLICLIRYVPFLRDCHLRTWPHTEARVVPWVMGAALAIRREAFEAVGGFDESFLMYFEEADLCYRLSRAGWQIHFAPVTSVVHVGGASTAQRRADMTVQRFVSTCHYYRRHCSKLLFLELVAFMRTMMLAKMIGGIVRLRLTRDVRQQARLLEDIAVSQRVLVGQL